MSLEDNPQHDVGEKEGPPVQYLALYHQRCILQIQKVIFLKRTKIEILMCNISII